MHRSTLAVVLWAAVQSAHAATFTPTRFDDPAPNGCLASDCSLREAVIAANATSAEDIVQLATGTYSLTRACAPESASCMDLDITQPVRIVGNSTTGTVIANAVPWFFNPLNPVATDRRQTRVIEVVTPGTVRLEKLTLRAGSVRGTSGNGADGGCLRSTGATVILEGARVTECETTVEGSGGGIATVGGMLRLTNTKVVFNHAVSDGGGIHASGTRIEGEATELSDNVAGMFGGGISTDGQWIWLGGGSKLARNAAPFGGGIRRWLRPDQINMTGGGGAAPSMRLIIEDNVASLAGGGIFAEHTPCESSSTCIAPGGLFANLIVRRNEAGVLGGGAMIVIKGSGQNALTIRDGSFSANAAGDQAGGLYIDTPAAVTSVGERLSFWANEAGDSAGGIFIAGGTSLRHVSSTRNIAPQGAALVVGVGGDQTSQRFDHWTTHAEGPNAMVLGRPVQFYASAFDGGCSGTAIDLGYNFKRNDVGGTCPGTGVASAQMGLVFADFVGNQPVVAITSNSILRNVAPPAAVGTRDARGYLRQGMADVGAYEFDGIP